MKGKLDGGALSRFNDRDKKRLATSEASPRM
jgi:hypothetical protein